MRILYKIDVRGFCHSQEEIYNEVTKHFKNKTYKGIKALGNKYKFGIIINDKERVLTAFIDIEINSITIDIR